MSFFRARVGRRIGAVPEGDCFASLAMTGENAPLAMTEEDGPLTDAVGQQGEGGWGPEPFFGHQAGPRVSVTGDGNTPETGTGDPGTGPPGLRCLASLAMTREDAPLAMTKEDGTLGMTERDGPSGMTEGRRGDGGQECEQDAGGPKEGCPLCRGVLALERGLWRCQGRCGTMWVAEAEGRLVDLAACPYGVCHCCDRPQVLVRGDQGPICPSSGRRYLLGPEGAPVLAEEAEGACQCCAPAAPLVWREGELVCQARPERRYRRVAQGRAEPWIEARSEHSRQGPEETLAAIDEALRRNNAWVTVNGLFDLD